jgi:hypothetical protein
MSAQRRRGETADFLPELPPQTSRIAILASPSIILAH